MTAQTLTLTDFLLARIAEDEALIEGEWTSGDGGLHIISNEMYDRLVAECEAKRRIVERCSAVDYAMPSTRLAHGILAELALPYADHPDYDPDWRP